MAKHVDHVLALLPFEPPYMEAAGMTCDFVGHPVISEPLPTKSEIVEFKASLNLGNGPVVTVLPGSRAGEIKRMLPIFKQVMDNVRRRYADVNFILPVAAAVEGRVKSVISAWTHKPQLLLNNMPSKQVEARKRMAYAISDAALATSGTVALELASQDCPMVVAYKANWATTRMVKKLAQIDTANLINIVTETRVVPEHLFENCTVDQITQSLLDVLTDGSGQKAALKATMDALGRGQKGADLWAAKSVLTAIQ